MENRWNIDKMPGTGPLPEAVVSPIDGAEMVRVPAGEFTMGISQEELYHISMLEDRENPVFATEVPAQNVYLEDYSKSLVPRLSGLFPPTLCGSGSCIGISTRKPGIGLGPGQLLPAAGE